MLLFLGVDACKRGWISISKDLATGEISSEVHSSVESLLDKCGRPIALAIRGLERWGFDCPGEEINGRHEHSHWARGWLFRQRGEKRCPAEAPYESPGGR